MTHLRQAMLDELERPNYAKTTVQYYLKAIERFAKHFHARRANSITRTSVSTRRTCVGTPVLLCEEGRRGLDLGRCQ